MLSPESSGRKVSVLLVKETEIGFICLSSSLKSFSISASLHRPCGERNRIFSSLCQWKASWEKGADWIVGKWADTAVGGSGCVCVRLCESGRRGFTTS